VNYKDQESLRAESEEGHRLGFDGKVSPHPLFVKREE
jgi:citrate lyase beta subunit